MSTPGSQAIKALLEIASGTIDAMQYAVSRAAGKLPPELMKGLITCKELAEKALFHSTESAWMGKYMPRSRLANLMKMQAHEALAQLDEGLKQGVILDIAINDQAQYKYGYYNDNNEALQQNAWQAFDTAFKGWLGENGIVVVDKAMCHANKKGKGEPEKDANGNNKRVDPEWIKNQLTDPEKGFAKYMQNEGYKVNINQVPYPQETAAPSI